ncbi:uncharacterized protein LOC134623892 [Pelmatolapia mariae]|uniref:uncharacterized protein LOC134623892 n=1 Tax=Pelmatolapia mariae TaxID=158779 RepID=UPI002FE624CF
MCTGGSRRAAAVECRLLLQQPCDHCKGGQRTARGEPEAGAPAGPAKLETEVEVRGGPAMPESGMLSASVRRLHGPVCRPSAQLPVSPSSLPRLLCHRCLPYGWPSGQLQGFCWRGRQLPEWTFPIAGLGHGAPMVRADSLACSWGGVKRARGEERLKPGDWVLIKVIKRKCWSKPRYADNTNSCENRRTTHLDTPKPLQEGDTHPGQLGVSGRKTGSELTGTYTTTNVWIDICIDLHTLVSWIVAQISVNHVGLCSLICFLRLPASSRSFSRFVGSSKGIKYVYILFVSQLSNSRRVWWSNRGTISAIWTQLSHYRGNNDFNTEDQKNITAGSGQDVTLTCRAPNKNKITVLEWSRAEQQNENVLLYHNERFYLDDQHPSFKNRVDLQDRQMKDGDVSLILKDVTINDTGTYECRVITGGTNRRKSPNVGASFIYLSVSSPGQTGGQEKDEVNKGGGKEDKEKEDGSVGLIVLSLLLVAAASVGFVKYKENAKKCLNMLFK